MLVVNRSQGRWDDRTFREFPSFLRKGDCLILNNSRVFPSRLYGTRRGGSARIEIFLLKPVSPDRLQWEALARPGRKVHTGLTIHFSKTLRAEVIARGELGLRTVRFMPERDLDTELSEIGHIPLPPYIKRADNFADRERYQTIYARTSGSVAAPTAGLHFTPEVLQECRQAGADTASITLHVGLGTFQPLHADIVEENMLHTERYEIEAVEMDKIRAAKRRIAIGTTSVRTVETAARRGELDGETGIFIYPGYQFELVDALLTNFHLPKSSLLMLVSAFAGRDLTLAAYEHAVAGRYRFFSYGDCMLIL